MINTEVRIHDKFSFEFKIGFITDNKLKDINEFRINTWFFIPNSLDINRTTYPKERFYNDVRANIRLITPRYTLDEILKEGRGPFTRLDHAVDKIINGETGDERTESYLYQIKMLMCVCKSAMREETALILSSQKSKDLASRVDRFVEKMRAISARYRTIEHRLLKHEASAEQMNYFAFGDEFLGNIIEQHCFALLRRLTRKAMTEEMRATIYALVSDENIYKKDKGFGVVEDGEDKRNSSVISRRGMLKKFVESDLFLQTERKEDGVLMRQFLYSIAAGLAMIFATLISFFATKRYGSLTGDLFVVLVISYMLKDRIKELARYFFTSQLSRKYFDNKWNLSLRKKRIGWIKEGMDFVLGNRVPDEVLALRARNSLMEAENEIYDESIICYRKLVNLSREDLEKYKEYRLDGVNDITRINLNHFIQKMDDPSIPLYMPDEENGYTQVQGKRMYTLYFMIYCELEQNRYYRKYRLLFNREGISDVSELD